MPRRVQKRQSLVNAQTVLMLIQNAPDWTARKLAAHLAVDERTVYRYVRDLRAIGARIESPGRGRAGYWLSRPFTPAPVRFTEDEAFALAAMCQELGVHQQIAFFDPAGSALEKIRGILPDHARKLVDQATRSVVIKAAASGSPDGHFDVYQKVRSSILTGRKLECRYEGLNRTEPAKEFLFEPYTLFFSVRAWYAVGRHSRHEDLRCLKLKRFTMMRLTDEPFEIPEGFSLREHLGNAWSMIKGEPEYDVELWVHPSFAETLTDTQWHPTQQVEFNPKDESVTFRCRVAGLDEIIWWVLGLGPCVKVVRPRELARKVADLADQVAKLYS